MITFDPRWFDDTYILLSKQLFQISEICIQVSETFCFDFLPVANNIDSFFPGFKLITSSCS